MDTYTPAVTGQEEKIQVFFASNQDPSKLTAIVNAMTETATAPARSSKATRCAATPNATSSKPCAANAAANHGAAQLIVA